MVALPEALAPRLILLHKQRTSARTRFFCLPGGVVLFSPLPAEATLYDADDAGNIHIHPTAFLHQAALRLGLDDAAIAPEAEFQARLATPAGDLSVLLGVFTSIDPPFAMAERLGGRFIALTEARALSLVERQLLQRVYEHVLG